MGDSFISCAPDTFIFSVNTFLDMRGAIQFSSLKLRGSNWGGEYKGRTGVSGSYTAWLGAFLQSVLRKPRLLPFSKCPFLFPIREGLEH